MRYPYDPSTSSSSSPARNGWPSSPEDERTGMRILIVDDESVIADSLALIFRACGFDARTAYSGEDALEIGQSFSPDVLISDVVMRGITGIELGIQMRGRFPACHILLFSGQAATLDLIQAADTKGYHFDILTKPVPPQVLLNCVQEYAAQLEPKHV
ncbi:response regulator [Acidobacteria bacterium AB60]|nr:response regulator [Acidobacteria bacterium AB60]